MARYSRAFLRILIGLLFIAASTIGTIAWYGMQNTLPVGLVVNNWQVEGLSINEFERQLTDKKKRLQQRIIRIISLQSDMPLQPADWTLTQLGLDVQIDDLLARLQPLRSGSPFQRASYRYSLRHATWEVQTRFDTSTLHATLMHGFPEVYASQPVDAQRIVGPNDTISYVPEAIIMRIDEAKLLEQLRASLPSLESMGWTVDSTNHQERRSSGTTETVTRHDSLLSTKPTMKGIEEKASRPVVSEPAAIIPLTFYKQGPAVTIHTLQAQGVERKISEFTTTYLQNSEGRIHNICSTAASIQDLLLKPGEVFDYATYIAETEAKFGFKEAPVILNGKLVPGIGGGICQVSSTLYNAVLRAGLDIVERRNHSLPVSYVPLGQDATFASGYINFKFRNSTPNYLLLRTSTDDRHLTVKLFGQIPSDVTYSIESKTVETLQPSVKYVLNPTLPVGKTQKISDGKPGYVVETYRYKVQNGHTIGSERISRDTYSAQPTIYASNQGGVPELSPPNRQPEAPLIEDGVKGPKFP